MEKTDLKKLKIEVMVRILNIQCLKSDQLCDISEVRTIPMGSSVKSLFEALAYDYGEPFKTAVYDSLSGVLNSEVFTLINHRLINEYMDYILNDKDEVQILPVSLGG